MITHLSPRSDGRSSPLESDLPLGDIAWNQPTQEFGVHDLALELPVSHRVLILGREVNAAQATAVDDSEIGQSVLCADRLTSLDIAELRHVSD